MFLCRHPMYLSCVQPLLRHGHDRPAVVEQEIGHHFLRSAVQALCLLFERQRPPRGTAHHPTRSDRARWCLVVPNEGYAAGLGQWVNVPAVNRCCCLWDGNLLGDFIMLVSRVDLHRFILPDGLYECKLHNFCITAHTYSELHNSLTYLWRSTLDTMPSPPSVADAARKRVFDENLMLLQTEVDFLSCRFVRLG